jgi:hypothetical protein
MNVEGDGKFTFIYCYMETTHEPLQIDKVWYSKRS